MNLNRVFLAGNLTRKPEVRFTAAGLAICKFGLASNERFKSGDEWREKATFVDVTIFGKRGEAFAKYHDKGSPAFLEGKLNFERWEDKQTGEVKSKLSVIADEWQFVGSKGDGGHQRGGGDGQGAVEAPYYTEPPAASHAPAADAMADVDDTPF